MANILIPTDFSDNSMHAAEYAVKLFGAKGNSFVLLHTYIDVSVADPVMPSMAREMMVVSEEGLQDFTTRLNSRTGVEGVKQEVRYGFLESVVNEIAASAGCQLVVMGKRGKGGSAFFGSNTTRLINRSHVPVLAVPETAALKKVERILLADDHDDILPSQLTILKQIALANNAEILVAHVEIEVAATASHWSDGVYKLALEGTKHSFQNAHGEDVINGLDRIARHQKVDMVAVLHRHIGLIGRLFHPSTAKELSRSIDLPLLVMEYTDK